MNEEPSGHPDWQEIALYILIPCIWGVIIFSLVGGFCYELKVLGWMK